MHGYIVSLLASRGRLQDALEGVTDQMGGDVPEPEGTGSASLRLPRSCGPAASQDEALHAWERRRALDAV